MAINVSHQPVTAVPAAAAYLGGLGQYQKYLDEMRLKQAQMAQQDEMQQRSIAASMAQQQNAQQFGLMNNMLDAAQRQQAMRMQAEMQQRFQGQQFGQQQAMAQLQAQLQAQNQAAHAAAMQKGYEAHDERLNRYKMDAESRQRAYDAARSRAMMPSPDVEQFLSGLQSDYKAPDGTPLEFHPRDQERHEAIKKELADLSKNPHLEPAELAELRVRKERELMSIVPTVKPETPEDLQRKVADPVTGQNRLWVKGKDGWKPDMPPGKDIAIDTWRGLVADAWKAVTAAEKGEGGSATARENYLKYLLANPPPGSGVKPYSADDQIDPKTGFRPDTGGPSDSPGGTITETISDVVDPNEEAVLGLMQSTGMTRKDAEGIIGAAAEATGPAAAPEPKVAKDVEPNPNSDVTKWPTFRPTPTGKGFYGEIGRIGKIVVVKDKESAKALPKGTRFSYPDGRTYDR